MSACTGWRRNCRAVDAIDWFVTDMVLDPMTVAKDTYVKVQDVMRTTGAETVVIGCTIVSACYELAVLRGDADLAALSVINPNVMAVKLAEMFADLAATKQYRISRVGYYQQHTSHDAEEAQEIMGLLERPVGDHIGHQVGSVMTSVVVVGGGLVGTATAYYAAREGMQVTLLEQRHTGYGASGRNPGFVWLHCRNPGWALEISLAGRALYDELARDLPQPFEFRAEGGIIYFKTPEQGVVFEEFVKTRQADGLDMELIDGQAVRELVGPIRPDVLGASFCSNDAQINTPTVVAALAAGARAEGVDVREGVEVTALVESGDSVVGVDTNEGRITADVVVIATGRMDQQAARRTRHRRPTSASSACRCSPPRRARSTSGPWSTGRWRPSSTRCSPTLRRGTSTTSWRRTRPRPATGCCSSCRSAPMARR